MHHQHASLVVCDPHRHPTVTLVLTPTPTLSLTLSLTGAEPVKHQLAALGVAAAWRLGRWDLLDRYLPAAEAAVPELLDGADRWEVRLGQLLSSTSKNETANFQEQVHSVQSSHMIAS